MPGYFPVSENEARNWLQLKDPAWLGFLGFPIFTEIP